MLSQSNLAVAHTGREIVDCKPFLKWAGGKGRLLPELFSRLPQNFETYHEPFLGAGALYFALQTERAVLSDINPELVNVFSVVQNQVEELILHLSKFKVGKREYYNIRNADRRGDFWTWPAVERAARMIYLNKTCFNGLYRVNSSGQFNVPFGDYENPKVLDEENLRACSQVLRHTLIQHADFRELLKRVKKDDFVYFDPPYVPLSETASFTSYSQDGFENQLHEELRDICRQLDKLEVKFLLSNSSTPLTQNLFSEWKLEEVLSSRPINSKAEKRGKVVEILVKNY